ncbi:MAG: thioredoxin domain-containing protein, partial [Pseudomonadota bacterium]
MDSKHPNRLISEKSPYLLQHAYNPVDWYPWREETFEKAEREGKPIFLSIGYSTCHWCHVMEKESFEDPEVARLMNETFVCIKVDREERPDIDSVYMTACQMMTGSGGWPLTIIMTPGKKPFFAATYIPKESRFGRKGMKALIPNIKKVWESRKGEVIGSAEKVSKELEKISHDAPGEGLGEAMLTMAYGHLSRIFDERYAGFGSAPKFPMPHNVMFLLRYWKRSGDERALMTAEKTLDAMRRGGIYDHVGFGFHRYSTDAGWLLPHFEKMLYDQASLAMAYTEAYQAIDKKREYKKTAREIFTYVLREMTDPGGGFYSAQDADSEGEEGRFYLWSQEEIRHILSTEEAELVEKVFNIEEKGNFLEEATGKEAGQNILHLRKSLPEIASDLKITLETLEEGIEGARKKLFGERKKRVHPHKDDKILTDWNGMMIAALAKGAQVFGETTYEEAARRSAHFILDRMFDGQGRLYHRYRDGEAAIPAFLDDYAFLIWGLIELYEATFESVYLERALDFNALLLEHFWDRDSGGFYFVADDAPRILVRKKEMY